MTSIKEKVLKLKMKKVITLKGLGEGEFLNRYIENKTIHRNQNALGVITGPTGSSKSMNCLSAGSNWYNYKFNDTFPINNCCFSPGELIRRIKQLQSENKLRKGEFFILEESGTNLGNLDYQNKFHKMFIYILQSFRSMNLVLLMNLPVLTMLNKSVRQLIHFNFITVSIDYEEKIARVKPLFLQLNQSSGKSYWKYPTIKTNGKRIKIERLKFSLPPKELVELYEVKKHKYVNSLTDDFINELNEADKELERKLARNDLSDVEKEVYDDLSDGLNIKESATNRGRGARATYQAANRAKKKGYSIKNIKNQENA